MDTSVVMVWLAADHSGSRVLIGLLVVALVVVLVGIGSTIADVLRLLRNPPRVRRRR